MPSKVEAKPHCVESASRSSGTCLAAASMRRRSSSSRSSSERLVVTSPQPLIGVADLENVLPPESGALAKRGTLRERLERFERTLVEEAMREHGSTRSVASALGISQSSVVRKLRRT